MKNKKRKPSLKELLEQGHALQVAGKLTEAIRHFEALCQDYPNVADLHNTLGNLHQYANDFESAIWAYQHGIQVNAKYDALYNGLGSALSQLGRHGEAIASYDHAIALSPHYANAYYNKGNSLKNIKQYPEALACYQKAIDLQPDFVNAYHNLGWVLKEVGRPEEALPFFEKTLALQPDHLDAKINQGNTLYALNQVEAARACFKAVLAVQPDHHQALNGLASIYSAEDHDQDAAIRIYHNILSRMPDYDIAYYNLGNAYALAKDFPKAISVHQKAISLNPGYVEAHWNLALNCLKTGDYRQGWQEYEWRLEKPDTHPKRPLTKPLWDGSPLQGKTLLILCEQGMGDMIQFIRYLPLVKARGPGRIILECLPPLVPFFKGLPDVDQVVAKITREEPSVAYDEYIYMMSLPHRFGTTLETIPPLLRYIQLDEMTFKTWRSRMAVDKTFKIGFAWGGNRENPSFVDRSCSFESFQTLFSMPNTTFYALQKGEAAQELLDSPHLPANVVNLEPDLQSFLDTACAIIHLDWVITIDTAVGHLAGSLHKPTWTMLPWHNDWRWLTEGQTTQWYPSVKLFRQSKQDDWPGVFQAIQSELAMVMEPMMVPH